MRSPPPPRASAPYPRRDLIVLFTIALAANTLAALFISRPGYMDAYYYFGGALQLARGRGFTEPYVWNYLDSAGQQPERSEAQSKESMGEGGGLSHPSHLYWMPLPSLLAAPFIALAERLAGLALPNSTLYRVAQIPFVVLASALPLLSYIIASLTTSLRRHALAAALLTLFSGFYFVFWPNTDAFALYGLTAGGALLAYALATQKQSPRWFFFAGLCTGLAHLTRADGVFLLGVLLFLELVGKKKDFIRHPSSIILLICGYLLITLPWFVRNTLVIGAPLVPGASRALWLTEYNDLFNYPADNLTLARYLASGWGSVLAGKWTALMINCGRLIGEQGTIVVFPFILMGLWKLRRNPLVAPAILYGVFLFTLMTFVFTFPGARGGLFHSGAALLPFFFSAAPVGLDTSVEAAARLWPHWQPEKSKPVFAVLLVAGAVSVTTLIFQLRVLRAGWPDPHFAPEAAYPEIGDWLRGQGDPQSIVAANDPPGFYYWTGHPSIVVTNGTPTDLLNAMSAFGAQWAVLDANHPDGLKGLYALPQSEPRLRLRATFTDAAGKPIYLFERAINP
jgi:hypothetical protein